MQINFSRTLSATIFACASFLGGMLSLPVVAMNRQEEEPKKVIVFNLANKFHTGPVSLPDITEKQFEDFFTGPDKTLSVEKRRGDLGRESFINLINICRKFFSAGRPLEFNLKVNPEICEKNRSLDLTDVLKNSKVLELEVLPGLDELDSFLESNLKYSFLRTFKMRDLNLTDKTAKNFCAAFPNLTTLTLSSGYLTPIASENALSILTSGLENLQKLTVSFHSSPKLDLSQLKPLSNLKLLNLNESNLMNQDLSGLKIFPSLSILSLAECQLNSEHVNNIIALIKKEPPLTSLNLRSNKLTRDDIQTLANAFNFLRDVNWQEEPITVGIFTLDLRSQGK